MSIMLQKARIKPEKQPLAKKWIDLLRTNREEGEKILKNEKEHLEVYSMRQEDETAYLHLSVLTDDLEYTNQIAQSSGNPLGAKHFEYMMTCIDPEGCVQLKPELALGDVSVFA